MIDLQAPFVLSSDVRLIPAEDLAKSDAIRTGCRPGDVVLSRSLARALSKALDRSAADLVRIFEVPTTLVDAIATIARSRHIAATEALDDFSGLLRTLINQGFLTQDAGQDPREPYLRPGQKIECFEIVRCIQMYDDTELHYVRDSSGCPAAMKVARTNNSTTVAQLEREADLHKRLTTPVAPKFLARGCVDSHPFFVVTWRDGRAVILEADALRTGDDRSHSKILKLCLSVLDAFAMLHESGVIHGDIHPNNILVDRSGQITVLDYGFARLTRGPRELVHTKRGGVGFFFEPEYAESHLRDRPAPPASLKGEQYALAALIYLLLTGQHYAPFSFDERTMFEQIRSEHPRSFAEVGCAAWPSVEKVLGIGLHKKAVRRFASVRAFADALRTAAEQVPVKATASCTAHAASATLDVLLGEVVGQLGPGAPLTRMGLNLPPKSSVHSGGSGIAYALYRIACVREDGPLLAAASLWSQRAIGISGDPDAYFDPNEGVTEATVGRSSIAHSLSGTALVQGLIAQALGDATQATNAIKLFVAASKQRCANPDLFLGRAGILHACSTLAGPMASMGRFVDCAPIIALGNDLFAEIQNELAAEPPIGEPGRFSTLGMAHGWSGFLYALMCWAHAVGLPMPALLPSRLEELASCAVATDSGLRWPIRVHAKDTTQVNHMPGWCNGGAGHVLTWLLAADVFGEADFVDLAVRSANDVLSTMPRRSIPYLCCGSTGAAYAMLTLYRSTGDAKWLTSAHRLAQEAVETIRSPRLPFTSLFRGAAGLAVLAADLRQPRFARMPVFGTPEWPPRIHSPPASTL